MPTDRFRLIQDGVPVAWAEGRNAVSEISRYVGAYSQDGPVIVERWVDGRWEKMFALDGLRSLATLAQPKEEGEE